MRILVIGAGGVGVAAAAIARRRDFFERMVLADVDGARARAAVDAARRRALRRRAQLDASDRDAIVGAGRAPSGADVVLNACDPRLNPPIFDGRRSTRAAPTSTWR